MASSIIWYGQALISAFTKKIDFTSDTIKVMLVTSAHTPNQDTHVYKDVSITNEVVATGYTAGGATLANKALSYDAATNTVKFDADDVSWTGTITARYAIIYDDTPASSKPLLAYIDFGEDTKSTNSEFKIQFSTSGIMAGIAA